MLSSIKFLFLDSNYWHWFQKRSIFAPINCSYHYAVDVNKNFTFHFHTMIILLCKRCLENCVNFLLHQRLTHFLLFRT